MPTKDGYQLVPDVEKGVQGQKGTSLQSTREKYARLNLTDKQAELLSNLDNTIESPQLKLDIASVNPSNFQSQTRSFLYGLLLPTITAVGTLVGALVLSTQKQTVGYVSLLVAFFPYINATLIFFACMAPIQANALDAFHQLSREIQSISEATKDRVVQSGEKIDAEIEKIRGQVNESLQPIQRTFNKASKEKEMIQRVDPSLKIPDLKNIDAKFKNSKGKLDEKFHAIIPQLDFTDVSPPFVRSTRAFYWHIVFPVLVLAFLLQMLVIFLTHYLMIHGIPSLRALKETESFAFDVNANAHDVTSIMESIDTEVGTYETELQTALQLSWSSVTYVASSYALSVVQLGLVYSLSGPWFLSFVSNLVIKGLHNAVIRKLQEYGIMSVVEDVMGTSMIRIREDILFAIEAESKLNKVLKGISKETTTGDLRDQFQKDTNRPSLLGRIFGQDSKMAKK